MVTFLEPSPFGEGVEHLGLGVIVGGMTNLLAREEGHPSIWKVIICPDSYIFDLEHVGDQKE